MNIKNCTVCKKIFYPVDGSSICGECIKAENEQFVKVRDYLRNNKGADINVVSEETGVTTKKILRYLKEGKLEVSDGMKDFLKCEKCGVSIRSGQYCRKCIDELSKNLSSILKSGSEEETNGPKMHFKKNNIK